MRNLRYIHRSLIQPPPGLSPTASTWDVGTNSLILAFGPTQISPLIELKRWHRSSEVFEDIAAWDAPPPNPELECDSIASLHYFPDTRTTCLVLAGGDLIVVREAPESGDDKIEIVGSVDAGIEAVAWAPDGEVLVVVTRVGTVLWMSREFEGVADATLGVDDLNVSAHVDVGWGKKETQFQGRKGKGSRGALRDPTVPEVVDEGSLSGLDDGRATVSWRGDGEFLAVNSVVETEQHVRRVVRVYSREGVLDSVSEPVDGLEGALSWRPAGNLIVGVKRGEEGLMVVFFERNGLRHGGFELRLSQEEIGSWGAKVSLSWNVDSSVLAVCFVDRVQLWTMGNYHYYLKQEIVTFGQKPLSNPVSLVWHPEKPLHFSLSGEEIVQRFAFASTVSYHPTSAPYDYGTVAVIDGKKLKLTTMRLANVPPPMALHELNLPTNAVDVVTMVAMGDHPIILIAVLHHGGVSIYSWSTSEMTQEPRLLRTIVAPKKDSPESAMNLQISAADKTSFVVLQNNLASSSEHLISMDNSLDGHELEALNVGKGIQGIVSRDPNTSGTLLLLADYQSGSEMDLPKWNTSLSDERIKAPDIAVFLVSRNIVEAISWPGERQLPKGSCLTNGHGAVSQPDVFSLAENGMLFVNDRCLVKNCTSFLVTPAHLILTTSQHLLKFVHLGGETEGPDVPPDTPETDERCRSIERGARLVTVMPSIFALVLQMPRGNLETIHPRALVLAGIRDSINKKKYKKAFSACRTQRVDMNILHDHAPQQFLDNVARFVDQVKKIEYIDLFLSQLRDEDVTKSMYQETLKTSSTTDKGELQNPSTPKIPAGETSKVNRICSAFLDTLDGRPDHLQNMISAHVCKQPPDLEAGLTLIARLRKLKSDQLDSAVEHICFLADVNRLYDHALGLYDLELALLIAQQSQKDPKEYLPFLQNLQKMHELRRRHSIDDHLKRYTSALTRLCELDAFEEIKTYATKHILYHPALNHYRYQESKYSALLRLYADHLHSTSDFASAALAYESLQDYPLATASYRLAHLWKESLTTASLIPLPPADLFTLAHSLAAICLESRHFSAAATIHHDHLADAPTAAALFCKGHFYADALRITSLHRLPDLLDTVIDPALIEGMATMTELLAECTAQLLAQIPRIHDLRAKKAADPLAFYDGDPLPGEETGAEIPDNVSLAPTDASTAGGGTLFTRYTNRSSGTLGTNATRRSSKNRRREERKRARGKKGSVYEEEYLVASVGRLVERVNSVGEEVGRLVTGLVRRGMRERAVAVDGAMVEVVGLCERGVEEVWGGVEGVEQRVGGGQQGEATVEEEMGGSVQPPPAPSVVKKFERLSLLAR